MLLPRRRWCWEKQYGCLLAATAFPFLRARPHGVSATSTSRLPCPHAGGVSLGAQGAQSLEEIKKQADKGIKIN